MTIVMMIMRRIFRIGQKTKIKTKWRELEMPCRERRLKQTSTRRGRFTGRKRSNKSTSSRLHKITHSSLIRTLMDS